MSKFANVVLQHQGFQLQVSLSSFLLFLAFRFQMDNYSHFPQMVYSSDYQWRATGRILLTIGFRNKHEITMSLFTASFIFTSII